MICFNRWLSLFAVVMLMGACKRSETGAVQSGPVSKADMQKAFADAPAEVREVAAQAAADAESQNVSQAFARLQSLSEVPELTPDQLRTIAQSRNAMLKQLQAEAEKGDQQAQQALRTYQSSR